MDTIVGSDAVRVVLQILFLAAVAMLFERAGRIIHLSNMLRGHEPTAIIWWARLKAAGTGLLGLYLSLAIWGPGDVPVILYAGGAAFAAWFVWWAADSGLRRRVRSWRQQ